MTTDLIPTRHFESLHALEKTYWWHQTRIRFAWAFLQPLGLQHARILDLGCGTGAFLKAIGAQLKAAEVVGLDASPSALLYLQQLGIQSVGANLDSVQTVRANGFDLVTAMDVVEHLEDPKQLISTANVNLCPGGHLLLSVPAHPFMFSDWDRMLNHFRRFTRKSLLPLVADGGFRVRRISYAFFIPFFCALAMRKMKKPSIDSAEFPRVPPWLNRLLLIEGRMEAAWLRYFPFFTGLSLYLLAQKTESPAIGPAICPESARAV